MIVFLVVMAAPIQATLKLAHDFHNTPPYGELACRVGYIKNRQLGWSTRCGTTRVPPSLAKKYKTAERRVSSSPALQLKSLASFSSRKDALPSLITFTLSDTKGMRDQLHANLNKLIGLTTEQGNTRILHNIMFINLNRKHEWTNF